MITKIIIVILIIGFTVGVIDSAEGFIEIKKYKVTNSPNVCGDKLCSDFLEDPKPFNKSSPFGQLKLGIAIDLIQCKEGQEILIKKTNQIPYCVNSENIEKLREKEWAVTEKMQEEIFAEIAFNRMNGTESSKTLEDFDVTINITTVMINNQRYLSFDGNGWHRLHNVEITITGETFSESVRTKTTDRGHLNMLWPIPDDVGGERYNIFATDGIHDFEIDIPISPKMNN